jgi:hypothetical protein
MSYPPAILSPINPLKKDTKMEKQICSLSIVIDGITYHYEAHSFTRVAEILAGQLRVLDTGKTNDYGHTVYHYPIDSFTVHYFQ